MQSQPPLTPPPATPPPTPHPTPPLSTHRHHHHPDPTISRPPPLVRASLVVIAPLAPGRAAAAAAATDGSLAHRAETLGAQPTRDALVVELVPAAERHQVVARDELAAADAAGRECRVLATGQWWRLAGWVGGGGGGGGGKHKNTNTQIKTNTQTSVNSDIRMFRFQKTILSPSFLKISKA